MDEDMRRLEKQYAQGDTSALAKIQAANSRLGLSGADADYLLQYLAICERVISRKESPAELKRMLIELNKNFETKVGAKTLKTDLPTLDAFREGVHVGSWNSSTIDCVVSGSQSGDPDTHLVEYATDEDGHTPYGWNR